MPHNRFDCGAKLLCMVQFVDWRYWNFQYFQYNYETKMPRSQSVNSYFSILTAFGTL